MDDGPVTEIRNTEGGVGFGGGEKEKWFCFKRAEFEVHVSWKGQRPADSWK